MSSNIAAENGLDPQKLPAHVAIIMDGNGRWAQKRLMNRVRGHEKGVEVVRNIVRASREIGVSYLTLYAFSTENWGRPKLEVSALMALLKKFLAAERDEMMENQIRFTTIGQAERLPEDVRKAIEETGRLTRNNEGMVLNLALSYGGRSELLWGIQQIAEKVKNGDVNPGDISEQLISDHLYTCNMPDPDLMIRTSGEQRISNFLLWQLAYAEFCFTETLWPDFTREEYVDILKQYQNRDRRFGKVKKTDA